MKRDKLLAEWFWVDRWDGSSAALLPIEPRGLYREMLTQAWRRGARLPNHHESIQRAIRCTAAEWERCWPAISHFWRVDGSDLVNDTQLEVYEEAMRARDAASERGRKGAQARAQARAQATTQAHAQVTLKHKPPSPTPTLTPDSGSDHEPPKPPDGGIRADEQQIEPKAPKRIGFDSTPTPDEQRVLDALNAATGARFTATTQELRGALKSSGIDACLLVVSHLASDPHWLPGGEGAKYFDPITPFRPKAWETRLAKARAWEEQRKSGRPPARAAPAAEAERQRTRNRIEQIQQQRAENLARRGIS